MTGKRHIYRKNGKFVKKSDIDRNERLRIARAVAAKAQRQRRLSETLAAALKEDERLRNGTDAVEKLQRNGIEGRRVVNMSTLCKDMWCFPCKRGLCFRDITSEKIKGLAYIWTLKCPQCLQDKEVRTSDQYLGRLTGRPRFEVNAKAALGSIDADLGPTKLNTVLSILNIPTIDPATLKRAEQDVRDAVYIVRKESCMESLPKKDETTTESPLEGTSPRICLPQDNNST